MMTALVRNETVKAALPVKRFRFLFDLGSDVALTDFVCTAIGKQEAIKALESCIPGASRHIKSVKTSH